MSQLNTTPLFQWHLDHGAKMAPFAGWDMPIQYPTGILTEHQHTRTSASIFDICHMGQVLIEGKNAQVCLADALSHKMDNFLVGKCRYGFLLNPAGAVIDDLIVYRLSPHRFLLVVNAARTTTDLANITQRVNAHQEGREVTIQEITTTRCKIDLQGPKSIEVIETLLKEPALPFRQLGYFGFTYAPFQGGELMISRTGYTGELGYEIYGPRSLALPLWETLAQHPLVQAAGLGARDTLRLESGLSLYGHELDNKHTPAESGLVDMLKSDADYVGKQLATQVKAQCLIPLRLEGRRSARAGDVVALPGKADQACGAVTSASFAPSLGYAIAFAFVDKKYANQSNFLLVSGKAALPATRTETPFYKEGTARMKF